MSLEMGEMDRMSVEMTVIRLFSDESVDEYVQT